MRRERGEKTRRAVQCRLSWTHGAGRCSWRPNPWRSERWPRGGCYSVAQKTTIIAAWARLSQKVGVIFKYNERETQLAVSRRRGTCSRAVTLHFQQREEVRGYVLGRTLSLPWGQPPQPRRAWTQGPPWASHEERAPSCHALFGNKMRQNYQAGAAYESAHSAHFPWCGALRPCGSAPSSPCTNR